MKHLGLIVSFCMIWALNILYGEMFVFWLSSSSACSWPHPISSSHNFTKNDAGDWGDYAKVVVITDPQLMDRTSLPLPAKSLALEIVQFYTDLFMRRAFVSSILPFKPDVILFLGDYFDGGPILSDEEWQESLNRFKHIFPLNRQITGKDVPVYFLSGNHDIGYSGFHSHFPEVVKRFESEFGIRNYRFTVGNVEFIAIDAQTLDGLPHNSMTSQSWGFVKNVSKDLHVSPRVLLTHIPLYRPDSTICGPHRSSPILNQRIRRAVQGQEIMYQNYLTKESSARLLDLIKPVLVLSGHDHDQCSVIHKTKLGPVSEQTLGTISWQQGNLYPSFMLLSLSNSTLANASHPEGAVFTKLCFLPMQTHIYIWYLLLLGLTVISLLLWPTNGVGFQPWCTVLIGHGRQLVNLNLFRGGTKEKVDDSDCEYEMIWDAEGSMHLVKKASISPTTKNRDMNLVERGNAVIRPTARKQMLQETDVSVDMNGSLLSDTMVTFPSRYSKSMKVFIIQRSLRTIRILIIIAAVNIPLYMMLIFKDWIDQ